MTAVAFAGWIRWMMDDIRCRLLNTYAGAVALGNIGCQLTVLNFLFINSTCVLSGKYYIVWVSFDVVQAGLWYQFGVETHGRTLEGKILWL
jgi:hypothetical protein